ncbi:MAG: sulfatase-like hydrolase/transferase, partial [Armatimonadetes bacterium]|nr:sulfatase-like hydrolase/transferase [Armatimonadota bacterium]
MLAAAFALLSAVLFAGNAVTVRVALAGTTPTTLVLVSILTNFLTLWTVAALSGDLRAAVQPAALIFLGAGVLAPANPQQDRPLRSRPNLILFLPDQLRAESIGCYGHPLVRTPNIDRLANSGVRFAFCQSAYPVCTASRCSTLTGWPPHVRGHRTVYHLLRRDEPNLFRYLKSAGYDVYWFGKNDVLTHDCFPESVTEWADLAAGPEWDVKDRPWTSDHPHYYSFLFTEGKDRRQYPDYARIRAAIDVLTKRDTDRPFCIFLATFFPHPPYA